MRYSVVFMHDAQKAIDAIDRVARDRIIRAIDALAEEPFPQGAIRLQGADGNLRVRVGDYRVLGRG